jgi:serine/threonine-protein kinase HipA
MRRARVLVHNIEAGILEEIDNHQYCFTYSSNYQGSPVSLTMPLKNKIYHFNQFPPFFEGLLPEGIMLEGLLRRYKLDKHDYLRQLFHVGHDLIGAVTVEEIK